MSRFGIPHKAETRWPECKTLPCTLALHHLLLLMSYWKLVTRIHCVTATASLRITINSGKWIDGNGNTSDPLHLYNNFRGAEAFWWFCAASPLVLYIRCCTGYTDAVMLKLLTKLTFLYNAINSTDDVKQINAIFMWCNL